jgi:hypothetical protein
MEEERRGICRLDHIHEIKQDESPWVPVTKLSRHVQCEPQCQEGRLSEYMVPWLDHPAVSLIATARANPVASVMIVAILLMLSTGGMHHGLARRRSFTYRPGPVLATPVTSVR